MSKHSPWKIWFNRWFLKWSCTNWDMEIVRIWAHFLSHLALVKSLEVIIECKIFNLKYDFKWSLVAISQQQNVASAPMEKVPTFTLIVCDKKRQLTKNQGNICYLYTCSRVVTHDRQGLWNLTAALAPVWLQWLPLLIPWCHTLLHSDCNVTLYCKLHVWQNIAYMFRNSWRINDLHTS